MRNYKVGDSVTFINDYGVAFLNKTIVGIDENAATTFPAWAEKNPGAVRYFFAPHDAPWFSNPASSFIPSGEPLPDGVVVYQYNDAPQFNHHLSISQEKC